MASEALLLIRRTDSLYQGELEKAMGDSEDDYLSKNYALLYATVSGGQDLLPVDLNQSRIVNEALEFSRTTPELEGLYRPEPNILLQKFYEGDYPDDDSEFPEQPSPAIFV